MSMCTIFRKMESMTSKITKKIFMHSFILEAHIENKRLNACGHVTNK